MEQLATYLSHVPIAIFFRYPVGHIGSAGYPHCPVVGVNPSFARRGRKAETERQDAQQASSPSGVADHLPPLLTRLFSSSSSSADRQTTKLLFSPSKTLIETQLSGQKHWEREREKEREGERGKERSPEKENIYLILKPLLSTWESWKFAFRVPSLCFSLFFPQRRRRKCTCLRAVRLCARVRVGVRAELLKADFSSPRTTRMLVAQLIGLSCGEMAIAPPHK